MDELERLKFPWLEDKAPFQIMKNVYFVGVDWVSAFLLDTSEGLVLIDCCHAGDLLPVGGLYSPSWL